MTDSDYIGILTHEAPMTLQVGVDLEHPVVSIICMSSIMQIIAILFVFLLPPWGKWQPVVFLVIVLSR